MTVSKFWQTIAYSEEFETLSKIFREGHQDVVKFETTLYEAENIRRLFHHWRRALSTEQNPHALMTFMGVSGVTTNISPPRDQSVSKENLEAYKREQMKPVTLSFYVIGPPRNVKFGETLKSLVKPEEQFKEPQRVCKVAEDSERISQEELEAELKEFMMPGTDETGQ